LRNKETLASTQVDAVRQYDSENDFKVKRGICGITIVKYTGSKTEVRIPPRIKNWPVTRIGQFAFASCISLTSLIIPNGVKSIEEMAFANCTGLKSLIIPDSVKHIEGGAFAWCRSLTNVNIPERVKKIEDWAFFDCPALISVSIPKSVKSIGEMAFDGCTNLTSITIGKSITSIGDLAFDCCKNLTSVTFQGTIFSGKFKTYLVFPGDLRDKFYETDKTNGTPGTYTRESGGRMWTMFELNEGVLK